MEVHLQYHKHHYFANILQAMHFKMDVFMYNLVHQGMYEMILYIWIDKLYKKGKTIEEALQILYKARNMLLLTPRHRQQCQSGYADPKKITTTHIQRLTP